MQNLQGVIFLSFRPKRTIHSTEKCHVVTFRGFRAQPTRTMKDVHIVDQQGRCGRVEKHVSLCKGEARRSEMVDIGASEVFAGGALYYTSQRSYN